MDSPNKWFEEYIRYCFDELKGSFTQEQSFHITLGVSALRWINMNNYYSSSNLMFSRNYDGYCNMDNLQAELNHFESQFSEFDGILTGLLSKTLIFEAKSAEEKLRSVFQIVNNINFPSDEEIRIFINNLTSIGIAMCGFNETPVGIKKLIIDLVDFKLVRSFADYCCGTSGIAVEIFEHLKASQMDKELFYHGEEINVTSYLISKLLMIINGVNNYEIINRDVFTHPIDGMESKFDLVISDIPQVMIGAEGVHWKDPRFKYGVPTRSSADWAFSQIVLHHLRDDGKGIVIGTKGTLVRSNDVNIRKGILEDDLIDTVITLPANLYERTNIGTELIIFNKNKSKDRKNKILFINASECSYRLNRNQHTLSDEGIRKIGEYHKYGIEEEHFSKLVDLEKIREYNYTLNPIEYLDVDVLKNSFDHSVSLKDIAQITRGVQLLKEDLEQLSRDQTHYFLNVKDIENGRISYDEDTMLTYKKKDWLGKFDIKPNDIILTSKGSTVRVAIVEENYRPAFISGNLTKIRVNPAKYNAYVLYEFLQSDIGKRMIKGIQTGTTITLLNSSQLEKLKVPLFDINFMNEIGNQIKDNKSEYEESITAAERRFYKNKERLLESLRFN